MAATLVAAALSGCGVPAPNGPAGTFGLDFSLPEGSQVRGAMVFAIDGVNNDVFQQMLDAGELPAFKKYFVDRGLWVRRAIANVPSVTLPNLTTMVTGRFPGHHNIMGVTWFDRNTFVWRNYATIAQKNTLDEDYNSLNIYELFPEQTTFSMFFQPHRGATKFVEDRLKGGPPFSFGWYDLVDRLTLSQMDILANVVRMQRRFPAVTYVYLLSPDFEAYRHGAGSAEYHRSLRLLDSHIGRVLGDIERAGLLDKLVIAMVSDHGHWDVGHHFDMEHFARTRLGLKVDNGHWWENDPFEERLEDYQKLNATFYGTGDRYCALCLRRPERKDGKFVGWAPWALNPTAADLVDYPAAGGGSVDLPQKLVELPAVDAVAFACGEDGVRVLRKNGQVEFRQEGGPGSPIRYRVICGDDPLGFKGVVPPEALNGKPLSPRQWLDSTINTEYPDIAAQLPAYFRSPRGGNIAVFAMPGWDFNHRHRSGHGGLRPQDMTVPMLLAGPGVPHEVMDHARTADLMPTLVSLLGRTAPPDLDGQSLLPPGPPWKRGDRGECSACPTQGAQ